MCVASMKRTSPPVPVTARPVDTPGTAVRSAASCQKRCRPSASRTRSASTATGGAASPDAMRVAVLRRSLPSSRSSCLTPASRVYAEPAGERTDVRAAMTADLGFVSNAAERHAHELAVQRTRDRLADRRLSCAGRPDQRQDRAGALVVRDAPLLAQLAHGQVFDDTFLDVIETCVVGVEDLARELRVEPLVGDVAPWHREQPVEVAADHRRLACGLAH